jgi:hypothetical protein
MPRVDSPGIFEINKKVAQIAYFHNTRKNVIVIGTYFLRND